MIYHMPKFWYSGSKKWGIKSDRIFIESKLQRLNEANQRVAAGQYEEIFKRYLNQGDKQSARYNANKMLNDFVNDFGITLKEYQNLTAANDDQAWIDSEIERLKKAQKLAKPHINFGGRKRA